jgi:quercetin dioxygenase-like cupin family protein
MDVVKFAEAPLYTAPGHEQVVARRLQGGAASAAAFALVGHTSFPSGAVIPMDTGTFGKVYVITEGAVTIEQGNGLRHVMHPGDSIYIAKGEARAVVNESGSPAAMIVITPPPAI